MIIGILIGIVGTLTALFASRGGSKAPPSVQPRQRDRCGVSIVLFGAGPDVESRMIDLATGGRGFSHVALDACEADERGPLLIDCRPGEGVHRRPLSDYGDRPRVHVYLGATEGAEVYGCIRGRIGAPFDTLGLVAPRTGPGRSVVCSQLIDECLPARLRDRIPRRAGRTVSPNDLAAAFDVDGPDDPDKEIA